MWFLRKEGNSGTLVLLPAGGAGQTPINRAYFPLSKGRVLSLAGASVASKVAAALITEVRATRAATTAVGGLWGISDSSLTTDFFHELAAESDPEMHLIGVAGLARVHDDTAVAALLTMAGGITRLEAKGFALHAVRSLGDGEPRRTQALGKLVESPDFDVKFAAAQTLGSLHSRDTLPFLAALLESPDARIRQEAIIGISRFVDNLPPLTADNGPPSFKWSVPLGAPKYRTPETDLYRPDMTRLGNPATELAYVHFWRSWWARMQGHVMESN